MQAGREDAGTPPDRGLTQALLGQASPSYRFTTEGLRIDGVRFDLARYPYLAELYDEPHPHIVIKKAAQLGLTAWAVVMVIERMRTLYKRGVLYTFPTDDEVYDFSQSRFDRLLKDNPMYHGLVHSTDRVVLKKVNEAILYMRGMRSKTKLLSIPVDLAVFDEFDEMEPTHIPIALERLSGSDFQHWIKLGHPTLPEYMIDLEWQRSDQRHWMIRCEHCGAHTCLELSFPSCLVRGKDGTIYRACDKCRKEIHVLHGDWVPATTTGEDIPRGYWMSQLLSPTVPMKRLYEKYDDALATGKGLATFYNMSLGMPYADIDVALNHAQVMGLCDRNFVQAERHRGPSFLGVDVGRHKLYCAVGYRPYGEKLQISAWRELETFDELFDLSQKYNVSEAVIDMGAEARNVRDFLDRSSSAWGCHYTQSKDPEKWDSRKRTVAVNRTESLDASHHAMTTGLVTFPRATPFFEKEVAKQLVNLVRVVQEDPHTGNRRPIWIVRGIKNDHFRHALNYALIAASRTSLSADTLARRRRRGEHAAPSGWMSV